MYRGMSTIFIYPILLGISWASWVHGVISCQFRIFGVIIFSNIASDILSPCFQGFLRWCVGWRRERVQGKKHPDWEISLIVIINQQKANAVSFVMCHIHHKNSLHVYMSYPVCKTNYSQTQQLKTSEYYFTVFEVQQSRSGLAGRVWLRISHKVAARLLARAVVI